MGSSFQRRAIRTTFQLATGTFWREDGADTVVLEGFRTSIEIDAPGGYEFAVCRARVYGIEQLTMDRMSVINYQNLDFHRNTMLVEATDDDGQYTVIFHGEIYVAHTDYTGAPEVAFVAEARSGLIGSLSVAAPFSFPGSQRVSAIMSRLARELGVALEDNGVTSSVSDMYLTGSPLGKVQALAEAARVQYWYVPEQGVLAIAPMGVPRRGNRVTYNFNTGMVGWPTKTHVGVMFTAIFNPAVFHGCPVLLESDVSACNGEWYVISMSHRLDSELPGGGWFTHFVVTPANTTIRAR